MYALLLSIGLEAFADPPGDGITGEKRRRGHVVQVVGASLAAAGLATSAGFAAAWSNEPLSPALETGSRVGLLLFAAGAPIAAHGSNLERHHTPGRDSIPAWVGGVGVALGAGATLTALGSAGSGWPDGLGAASLAAATGGYGAAAFQHAQNQRAWRAVPLARGRAW